MEPEATRAIARQRYPSKAADFHDLLSIGVGLTGGGLA